MWGVSGTIEASLEQNTVQRVSESGVLTLEFRSHHRQRADDVSAESVGSAERDGRKTIVQG